MFDSNPRDSHISVGEYLPQFMRVNNSFAHIVNTENHELAAISDAVDAALDNSFSAFADFSPGGIARWEKLLGIIPQSDAALRTRRLEVLTRRNDRLPYTHRTLDAALTELFGNNGTARHILSVNAPAFTVTVTLLPEIADLLPIVQRFVRGRVPANMIVNVSVV
ncbi:MAG: YmfQ family protein [Oscillospiraceae bacterium]|nr:YmfQ family protein [Oscillospiraceae bacterium]